MNFCVCGVFFFCFDVGFFSQVWAVVWALYYFSPALKNSRNLSVAGNNNGSLRTPPFLKGFFYGKIVPKSPECIQLVKFVDPVSLTSDAKLFISAIWVEATKKVNSNNVLHIFEEM